MSKLITIAVLTLALIFGACLIFAAQEASYTLRPVTTIEDAVKCAEDGGRGAFVFELDSNGEPSSDYVAFCLVPAR